MPPSSGDLTGRNSPTAESVWKSSDNTIFELCVMVILIREALQIKNRRNLGKVIYSLNTFINSKMDKI